MSEKDNATLEQTTVKASEVKETKKEASVEATASTDAQPKKKKLSKGACAAIIAVFAVISFIVGMIIIDVPIKDAFSKTKTFTVDEMSITLPKDFNVVDNNFTACYSTEHVSVFVTKDAFTEENSLDKCDLDGYRLRLLDQKDLSYADLKDTENNPYFVYEYVNTGSNVTYSYYTFTYKSDNAFWTVKFATEKGKASQYEKDIIQWAKTVTFTNSESK